MRRTPFTISYWNGARFPAAREGQAKWKVVIGDGVQDLCREALCPKRSDSCPFGRRARKGAAMC